MLTALFPGSFDPPTLGHLDIIKRAAAIVDRLYVGVAENSAKEKSILSLNEKIDLLSQMIGPSDKIQLLSISGLTADVCKEKNISFIIRALRSSADYDFESKIALANQILSGGTETLFLTGDPKFAHISSSLVREIAHFGGPLEKFVAPEVEKTLKSKFRCS